MFPGTLGVEEAQHAARAECPGFRVDAAIDVFDADPLGRYDAVHQLDGNRCIVEENHRADQQLAQQFDDLSHALGAGRWKAPAALEQVAVNGGQLAAGKLRNRSNHTTRLFQQAEFTALVIAKLFRQLFRRAGHCQLFGL
ncbi:hypothetical protein D3C84_849850 [compost metagenome]